MAAAAAVSFLRRRLQHWSRASAAVYGIEDEAARTVAGLATGADWSWRGLAQKRGDLRQEADTRQVTRVLKVIPPTPPRSEFKKANDKLLAERAGADSQRRRRGKVVAAAQKEKAEAMTKVTDGRILLEAGRI